MKRNTLMMLLAVGLLSVTGAGVHRTYSYFTHKESVNNVFTVGNLEIGLKEPEWNPQEGDGQDIYPGYNVYKNPTVKNIKTEKGSAQPCYLMMKVKALDEHGNEITDQERLNLIRETIRYDASYTGGFEKKGSAAGLTEGKIPGYSLLEIKKFPMVNPEFDELAKQGGEWTFGYHGGEKMILKENEEKVLFTNVVFPTDWTAKEMELVGEFQLEVSALAIQSEGFLNRTDAFAVLTKK